MKEEPGLPARIEVSQPNEPDIQCDQSGEPSSATQQVTMAVDSARAARKRRALRLPRGTVLGFRYEVEKPFGRGGFGEVYRGQDLTTGDTVAVKVLHRPSEASEPAVPREVSVLRVLRIPGTVRMLDEGIAHGLPYLVMDFVEGRPFPGRSAPCTWDELAPTVVALLESLDRIHHAGFVHRDLKPDNVLVGSTGIPTILDLGLAHPLKKYPSHDEPPVEGTLAYLAPELLEGRPPSPRSDLYSVGVMLWEALIGARPVVDLESPNAFARRFEEDLAAVAAQRGCDETVTHLLKRLLAAKPSVRPASAAAVLKELGGHAAVSGDARPLPLTGPARRLLERLEEEALAGRSLTVRGDPGMGRTRILEELAARWKGRGKEVSMIRGREGIFDGLRHLRVRAPSIEDPSDQDREDLLVALRSRLEKGALLLVDDDELLDPTSRELLEEARKAGPVISTTAEQDGDGPLLAPLSEEDLRELFAGPDRIHHLREDAARLLYERTSGTPAEVAAVVGSWLRAGLARWEGDVLRLSRQELDRIPLLGGTVSAARGLPAEVWPEEPGDRRLLALLWASGGLLPVERLRRLAGRSGARVDADLRRLEKHGLIARRPGDAVGLACDLDLFSRLGTEEVRELHAGIADLLEAGEEGRFLHLAAAGKIEGLPEEILALAGRLRSEGRLGPAFATLVEGLALCRRDEDPQRLRHLLEELLLVGVELGTVTALQRALYEIETSQEETDSLEALRELGRGALVGLEGHWERALELAGEAGPFERLDLELARHSVRLVCAYRGSLTEAVRILTEIREWADERSEPVVDYRLANWLGLHCYHENRLDEAAALQQRAVEAAPSPVFRVAAMLTAGGTLLQGGQFEEARRIIARARTEAADLRAPHQEARALALERAILYRMAKKLSPAPELVEDMAGFGWIEAFAALTEAAFAMRRGSRGLAADLACRAEEIYRSLGEASGWCLAGAIAAYCGGRSPEVREKLIREAEGCPLPERIQSLGLLAASADSEDSTVAAELRRMALDLPRREWSRRREVLSIEEAVALAEGKERFE